ncbi:hypothetical protein AMR72_13025 [Flavobacterium psychrophilum]|nr:hypothetical protein AMR72_13025 [Flavobacterium psychrophilum]AOE53359.1 hypothetical protein ALW18_13015 [Flavobacterium psychrophilum]
MKNILLAATFILTFTVNASVVQTNAYESILSIDQEKEFKKIETTQIPAEVLKQASTKYSGFALKGAQASGDGEYKLVLFKDGKSVTAHYRSTGEFVKEAHA